MPRPAEAPQHSSRPPLQAQSSNVPAANAASNISKAMLPPSIPDVHVRASQGAGPAAAPEATEVSGAISCLAAAWTAAYTSS